MRLDGADCGREDPVAVIESNFKSETLGFVDLSGVCPSACPNFFVCSMYASDQTIPTTSNSINQSTRQIHHVAFSLDNSKSSDPHKAKFYQTSLSTILYLTANQQKRIHHVFEAYHIPVPDDVRYHVVRCFGRLVSRESLPSTCGSLWDTGRPVHAWEQSTKLLYHRRS